MKKTTICSKCVMDGSDPGIFFNEKGECDHCITFKEKTLPAWNKILNNRTALEQLSLNIKNRNKGSEYDCLIGVSGGVDSSYLVHIATEVMDLKPLIFHVDAGWNSDIAVNNIEKLIEHLNLDLYTDVINWEEMKDLQRSFFKSGVPHLDTPQDHAFFATMYKFAKKYKIKNILTGANLSTECIRNPVEWMYYQSDLSQLKDIHKKFGKRKLKSFPTTSVFRHKILLPYFFGIKVFKPLDYVDYDKEKAKQFLKDKYGWVPYPQKHFESRFTRFYESYWLYEKFGFDVRKVQFSSLILTGQMSRDEAIRELKEKPYSYEEVKIEKEFIASKLNFTLKELEELFLNDNKSFRDYKNQYWLYNLGKNFYEKLNLGVGNKR